MLEIIFNVLLLLFSGYTLCFHVLEARVPEKVARNPYALQPNIWPGVLLVLLMICLAINILRLVQKSRGTEALNLSAFGAQVTSFFKSKLCLGILLVVVASFVLEPLGFMVTSFLLLISYGILLGERKWLRLALVALGITLLLYISFGVLLSVNLPRGTVPFLRNFALFIESLLGR